MLPRKMEISKYGLVMCTTRLIVFQLCLLSIEPEDAHFGVTAMEPTVFGDVLEKLPAASEIKVVDSFFSHKTGPETRCNAV